MDPVVGAVAAIVGVITGLGALGVSVLTARSTARKVEVEAVGLALGNLREDYERLDELVDKLRIEVGAWKRRFARVCKQAGFNPDEFITQPIGTLTWKLPEDEAER